MIRVSWTRNTPVSLIASLLLLAGVGLAFAPGSAAAGGRCNDYCSGPGKNYKECMDRCIGREDEHHADRDIRALCASKGHDEEQCLREHGFGGYAPPPPAYYPPPRQPMRCYRDQFDRMICQPD